MSTNKLERYLRLGDLMFNEPFYRSFVNVKYAARFIQDPRTDLKTIDIFLNLLKQAQNTPPTPGRQDNLNVTPQVNPSGNQGTQSRDTRQPTTPSGGSPQTQSPVTTPLTQTTPGQTPPQPEAPKSPPSPGAQTSSGTITPSTSGKGPTSSGQTPTGQATSTTGTAGGTTTGATGITAPGRAETRGPTTTGVGQQATTGRQQSGSATVPVRASRFSDVRQHAKVIEDVFGPDLKNLNSDNLIQNFGYIENYLTQRLNYLHYLKQQASDPEERAFYQLQIIKTQTVQGQIRTASREVGRVRDVVTESFRRGVAGLRELLRLDRSFISNNDGLRMVPKHLRSAYIWGELQEVREQAQSSRDPDAAVLNVVNSSRFQGIHNYISQRVRELKNEGKDALAEHYERARTKLQSRVYKAQLEGLEELENALVFDFYNSVNANVSIEQILASQLRPGQEHVAAFMFGVREIVPGERITNKTPDKVVENIVGRLDEHRRAHFLNFVDSYLNDPSFRRFGGPRYAELQKARDVLSGKESEGNLIRAWKTVLSFTDDALNGVVDEEVRTNRLETEVVGLLQRKIKEHNGQAQAIIDSIFSDGRNRNLVVDYVRSKLRVLEQKNPDLYNALNEVLNNPAELQKHLGDENSPLRNDLLVAVQELVGERLTPQTQNQVLEKVGELSPLAIFALILGVPLLLAGVISLAQGQIAGGIASLGIGGLGLFLADYMSGGQLFGMITGQKKQTTQQQPTTTTPYQFDQTQQKLIFHKDQSQIPNAETLVAQLESTKYRTDRLGMYEFVVDTLSSLKFASNSFAQLLKQPGAEQQVAQTERQINQQINQVFNGFRDMWRFLSDAKKREFIQIARQDQDFMAKFGTDINKILNGQQVEFNEDWLRFPGGRRALAKILHDAVESEGRDIGRLAGVGSWLTSWPFVGGKIDAWFNNAFSQIRKVKKTLDELQPRWDGQFRLSHLLFLLERFSG